MFILAYKGTFKIKNVIIKFFFSYIEFAFLCYILNHFAEIVLAEFYLAKIFYRRNELKFKNK